jgi:hypothetical protein
MSRYVSTNRGVDLPGDEAQPDEEEVEASEEDESHRHQSEAASLQNSIEEDTFERLVKVHAALAQRGGVDLAPRAVHNLLKALHQPLRGRHPPFSRR